MCCIALFLSFFVLILPSSEAVKVGVASVDFKIGANDRRSQAGGVGKKKTGALMMYGDTKICSLQLNNDSSIFARPGYQGKLLEVCCPSSFRLE